MAIILYASGTQVAVIATEHVLSSPNVAGRYQLALDLDAMVAGDVLEVRAYRMVLTGGTSQLYEYRAYYGVDGNVAGGAKVILIPDTWVGTTLTDATGLQFSITQTLGTGRSFPWAVLKDDALLPATVGRTLDVDASGRVTLGTLVKAVALSAFPFCMMDSTDHVTPKTGLTVTVQRSIDGAAFANCATPTATEIGAGWYKIDLAAADLAGDTIALKCTATGADPVEITLLPER